MVTVSGFHPSQIPNIGEKCSGRENTVIERK